MTQIMKKIPQDQVLTLVDQIDCASGQIISMTLAQSRFYSMTLFAFDAGEEISAHDSEGDAMIQALDGSAAITVGGSTHLIKAGQCIIMPAKVPHAVFADKPFKMLLTVLFSPDR